MAIPALFLAWSGLYAQEFDADFEDATLRLDYVMCGDAHHQAIYFQRALKTSEWAGRRNNLTKPLLDHSYGESPGPHPWGESVCQ